MAAPRFFAFLGPSRRADHRVVEVQLAEDEPLRSSGPVTPHNVAAALAHVGILDSREALGSLEPPASPHGAYLALLAQTALRLQQAAGHHVENIELIHEPPKRRWVALVEHEQAEVGLTAVKMAAELMNGRLTDLAEAFGRFRAFALDRQLPRETQALIQAAEARNIPWLQLDRPPLKQRLNGTSRFRPNGLLWLGQCGKGQRLDNTWCSNRASALARQLLDDKARQNQWLQEQGVLLAAGDAPLRAYLVVIGGRCWSDREGPIDPETRALALALHQRLGDTPLGIGFADCLPIPGNRPATPALCRLDFAPDLARLPGDGADSPLAQTASALVDHCIPPPDNGRVPVIAITGTNGKTTTTRLIRHALQQAGHTPAMASTDGLWVGHTQLEQGDRAALAGHGMALLQPDADCAVLETHHTNLLVVGFTARDVDVGLCLNVTEDHLGGEGIDTVEEMAVIKRSLPERARRAAIVFADDPHCRAMIGHLDAERVGLVSLERDHAALADLLPPPRLLAAVVEGSGDEAEAVLYDGDTRLALMPVRDIPITFGGAAAFNLSNALHAALALHQAGLTMTAIAEGLRTFLPSEAMSPGRLNEFNQLPFRVIMDFAHNPDGMRQVARFANALPVAGRRLVAFSGGQGRSEGTYRRTAAALAGHFDHYFCKEYVPPEGKPDIIVAPILRDELLRQGVASHQIDLMHHGRDVIFRILDACQPGDLLMMLMGHVEKRLLPGYIEDYAARLDGRPERAPEPD